MIFRGTWSQYWRSLIGTIAQISLLYLGILLFSFNSRFSFLWWIGLIDYLIVAFLTIIINNRFIVNNDKEMVS